MKLTSADKEKLFVGADAWTTHSTEDLPSVRVSDGPGGLRIEAVTGLGFNRSHPAVCHPTASLLACSFDRELLHELGEMLAEECQAQSVDVLLGPGVNHKRSPLCGRNFEYYSEDPVLSGELGASYVNGLQENGIGASLKHFAGNSREKGRLISDSLIDERALREIYLKQFETVVRKAHPWTIMAAYNKLNGIYCTQNRKLLKDTARNEWGFDGVFVSDWGAVSDPVSSMKGGLNLEMPGGDHGTSDLLDEALKSGALTPEELDESAEYMLNLVQKTGYAGRHRFDLEKHLDFARKAAQQSAVLLENNGALPLRKEQKIALIGAFAKKPRYQGAGSSNVNAVRTDNLFDVMDEAGIRFTYAAGYDASAETPSPGMIQEAVHLAKHSDCAVIVAGLPEQDEAEGYDRKHLDLPENQNELIKAVAAVQKNTVVVLQCGAPVILPWRKEAAAVLCMYLSGSQGSHAAFDLLYGNACPCGHLAETWPLRLEDTPSYRYFDDDVLFVQYRESIFTGYRYYDTFHVPVAYPFGYGLSYTSFEYSSLRLQETENSVKVWLDVKNTGSFKGRAVVQIYTGMTDSRICRADHELKDFGSVELAAGEVRTVSFEIPKESLKFYDVIRNEWVLEDGTYRFMAADHSGHMILEEDLILEGETDVHALLEKEYLKVDDAGLTVSKQDFETVYAKEIPEDVPLFPFTRDTAIADLEDTRIGRLIHRGVRQLLDRGIVHDVEESMIWEAPVRMMLMGSHRFTWHTVDGVVEVLNGHPVKGVRRIMRSLKKK
ncbi:MAG: glycoside hydrolase family 3 C-terminal domain-containing protein [Solobacterium sp.]|nr:glycoside hydrolase family 3 C-terminal domain-containing protein [Solobacterium sp.]